MVELLDKFFPPDRFFPEPIVIDSDSDDDELNNNNNNTTSSFQVPTPNFSLPATLEVSPHSSQDIPKIVMTIADPNIKSILKRPKPQVGSIAEYKTKNLQLKPASAYAKPSVKDTRTTFTVPYKKPIVPKKQFDPREEAVNLQHFKEKSYLAKYCNVQSKNKTDDSIHEGTVSNATVEQNSSAKLEVVYEPKRAKKCIPIKKEGRPRKKTDDMAKNLEMAKIQMNGRKCGTRILRNRAKQSYVEETDDDNESEEVSRKSED